MMLNLGVNGSGTTLPVAINPTGTVNDVRTPSLAVQAMAINWNKITTLLGGTQAMRAAAELYLPKWTDEIPGDYKNRLKNAVLFNAFGHTGAGLGGKPFTRPISWTEDTPEQIASWFPNIDLTGRSLDVFAQEVFTTGLEFGLTHVLVDYPVVQGITTLAQEKASGARPYLVHVKPDTILGWRSEIIEGAQTLTQLRILEMVEVADGPFATITIEQVRVLTPGAWAIYRNVSTQTLTVAQQQGAQQNAEPNWQVFDSGTTTMPIIPLVTYYTGRTGFMTAESPLIDIADLNILHWQCSSDMYTVLHVASVPILTISGIEANDEGTAPLTVSAKAALTLPTGAEAKYTEHSGKAVAAGADAIANIEEQMRLLGAEMLVKKPGQATATQATLDTSQQRAELQSLTGIFEDTFDRVIEVMAQYAQIMGPTGNLQVYKDFLLAADDAVQEALLFSICEAGLLSQQTFYEEMQRRSVYYTDLTWQQEQERIKAQPLPTPPLPPPSPAQTMAVKVASSSVTGQLND